MSLLVFHLGLNPDYKKLSCHDHKRGKNRIQMIAGVKGPLT